MKQKLSPVIRKPIQTRPHHPSPLFGHVLLLSLELRENLKYPLGFVINSYNSEKLDRHILLDIKFEICGGLVEGMSVNPIAFREDRRLCLRAAKTVARNSIATLLKCAVLDPTKLDLNVLDGDTEGKLESSVIWLTERAGAPCIFYTWRWRYVGESLVEVPEPFIFPIEDFETIRIRYLLIRELKQAE